MMSDQPSPIGYSGHLGNEGYKALAADDFIELDNGKTLTFKDPEELTTRSIVSNQKISLSYKDENGTSKNLSLKIGQNTPLYNQIQNLSSKDPGEQKVVIKALVVKYVATLLDAHEIGQNGVKKVSAQFDRTKCTKVLTEGEAGVEDVSRKNITFLKSKEKDTKINCVCDHFSYLATQNKVNAVCDKVLKHTNKSPSIAVVPVVEGEESDTEIQTAISGAQKELETEDKEVEALNAALDAQEKIWEEHTKIDEQIKELSDGDNNEDLERLNNQIYFLDFPKPSARGWHDKQIQELKQEPSGAANPPYKILKDKWLRIMDEIGTDCIKSLLTMGVQARYHLKVVDSPHKLISFLNTQTKAYTQMVEEELEDKLEQKKELLRKLREGAKELEGGVAAKTKRNVYENPIPAPFKIDSSKSFLSPEELNELEYKMVVNPEEIKTKLEKEKAAAAQQPTTEANKSYPYFDNQAACLQALSAQAARSGTIKTREFLPEKKGGTRISIEYGTLGTVGFAESGGRCGVMQDAHIAGDFLINIGGKSTKVKITGIFDGHGDDGENCSEFAKDNIIKFLKLKLEELNVTELTDLGVWNALKLAFVDLSRSYNDTVSGYNTRAGSTANVALMIGEDLWVANLGDSRAILVGPDGRTTQLSEDANAIEEKYERGIGKRGHYVEEVGEVGKIDGELAVARSLGDHFLKGGVSARPKITKFKPPGGWDGYHLVQCCDGIYDVSKSSQVGDLVYKRLQEGDSTAAIASKIVQAAFKAGSRDNLSAMVVPIDFEEVVEEPDAEVSPEDTNTLANPQESPPQYLRQSSQLDETKRKNPQGEESSPLPLVPTKGRRGDFSSSVDLIFSENSLKTMQTRYWRFFSKGNAPDGNSEDQWKLFINPNRENFEDVLSRVLSSQANSTYINGKIVANDSLIRKSKTPVIEDPCEPKMLLYFTGPTGFLDFKRAVNLLENEFKEDASKLAAGKGSRIINGVVTPQKGPSFTKNHNDFLFYTQGGYEESGREAAVEHGLLNEQFEGENFSLHKGCSDPLENSLPPFLNNPLDKNKLEKLQKFLEIISSRMSDYLFPETLETLDAINKFMEKSTVDDELSSFEIAKATSIILKQMVESKLKMQKDLAEDQLTLELEEVPTASNLPEVFSEGVVELLFSELSQRWDCNKQSENCQIGSDIERSIRRIENNNIQRVKANLREILGRPPEEAVSFQEVGDYLGISPLEVEAKEYMQSVTDLIFSKPREFIQILAGGTNDHVHTDNDLQKCLELLSADEYDPTILSKIDLEFSDFGESIKNGLENLSQRGQEALRGFLSNNNLLTDRKEPFKFLRKRTFFRSEISSFAACEKLPSETGEPSLESVDRFIQSLESDEFEDLFFSDSVTLLQLQRVYSNLEKSTSERASEFRDRIRVVMEKGIESANYRQKHSLQAFMKNVNDAELIRSIASEKIFETYKAGEEGSSTKIQSQSQKIAFINEKADEGLKFFNNLMEKIDIDSRTGDEIWKKVIKKHVPSNFYKHYFDDDTEITKESIKVFLSRYIDCLKQVKNRQQERQTTLEEGKNVNIPRYFHATPTTEAAIGIANTGIEYGVSTSATGAFISTKAELRYGSIVFALPEETHFTSTVERGSFLSSKTNPWYISKESAWAGLSEDININSSEAFIRGELLDCFEGSLRRCRSINLTPQDEASIMCKIKRELHLRHEAQEGQSPWFKIIRKEEVRSNIVSNDDSLQEWIKDLIPSSLSEEDAKQLSLDVVKNLHDFFGDRLSEKLTLRSTVQRKVKVCVGVPDQHFEDMYKRQYNDYIDGCKKSAVNPIESLDNVKKAFSDNGILTESADFIPLSEMEIEIFLLNKMGILIPKEWPEREGI